MASQRIQPVIPMRDACKREPILVVLFGKIFRDRSKTEDICRVIDSRSQFVLERENNMWPTYALICDVEEDAYGNSGTVTDIYKLAATAKSRGWEAVAFIDELSWRQNASITTNLEDPTFSATVVSLTCVPAETLLSPSSTFYIRRLPIVMAMAEVLFAEPQKPKDWSQIGQYARHNYAFELHLHAGFYLHCPFEPIFGSEDLAKYQKEALEKGSRLPQEIKDQIMTYVQVQDLLPLQDLIDTVDTLTDTLTEIIQPLIHLEDAEIALLRQQLQAEMPSFEFPIGRWKSRHIATRRDVSRIVRHVTEHFKFTTPEIIFILGKPGNKNTFDFAVYTPAPTENGSHEFGSLHRMTIESLGDWNGRRGYPYHGRWGPPHSKTVEDFVDPAHSFPVALPPWYKRLPLLEIYRGSRRFVLNHDQYLVFYLTNQLTDEEQRRIEDYINEDRENESDFIFIPWEKPFDGGVGDMLHLMKTVEIANKDGFPTPNHEVITFIDRQSALDRNVIICAWEHDRRSGNGHTGITYGRYGDNVESLLSNVPGNMNLDECIDERELHFFRNPDFSAAL